MSEPKDLKKYIKYFWYTLLGALGLVLLLFILAYAGAFGKMPSFVELENPSNSLATEVYSGDGVLLGKYYYENRSNTSFEEIPKALKNALIATEDERFYEHSGIDFKALFRAIITLGTDGGGSTITQQLAKNLFTTKVSNIKAVRVFQKFKEWITAVKLERRYTKDEILNLYLNTVQFSENSYGVKSAARTYFNKIPDSLTVDEAALLVGMLKGSTLYNPKRNPENAIARRNVVLAQMEKYGFLTHADYLKYRQKPIVLHYVNPDHNEGLATYFREQLRQDLMQWCRENKKPDGSNYNIYSDGLRVYTTIDSHMQQYAEEAVAQHMKELQAEFFKSWRGKTPPWGNDTSIIIDAMYKTSRYQELLKGNASEDSIRKVFNTKVKMTVFSWRGDIDTVMTPMDSIKYSKYFLQTGFMVMDPYTGFIKAWVGGINEHYYQFDHVNITAKRQVGSTFKPIVYSVAIANGYSPCFKVPNERIVFENYNNWSPQNAEDEYGGMLTLYQGLAHSVNTITAYLIKQVGTQPVIELARRMGITSHLDPYPSLALGVPDISVYEMTGAYTTFVNKGVYTKPIYIERIEDKNGNVLQEYHTSHVEALDEQSAYVMLTMLKNVVDAGTAVRLRNTFKFNNEMAGKTGTTQNNTDGWFVGIIPQLVGGAWVGGDDRVVRFKSLFYGQGANMALPTWGYFLQKVYADKGLGISDKATFDVPPGPLTIETDCGKYEHQQQIKKTTNFGDEFNK
jgi:penicillin-binding protein 1A